MRYDPLVFDRKTVFMQRLADQVRRGYFFYTLGEVRIERAPALVAKFARLYNVHLHRNQKLRERAAGLASADMLLWRAHTDSILFCLLITSGPHTAHAVETMHDTRLRGSRLTLGEFELTQRARAGSTTPAWTWRLTKEAYEGWRLRALEVCRSGNDFEVRCFIDTLLAMPGFAGVREQVRKLRALFRAEWRRRRPDGQALPRHGQRQRYVQRLPNSGARLSQAVRSAT